MRTLKTGRRPARPKTAKERKAEQLLDDAKRLLAGFPGRTGDMDFMIDAAGTIVSAKKFLDDRDDDGESDSPPEFRELHDKFTRALAEHFIPAYLREAVLKYSFTPVDMRIILVLASVNLGLGVRMHDIKDLQNLLCFTNQERLELVKHLLPEGRLAMSRIVEIDYSRDTFINSHIHIAESFVKPLLRGDGRFSSGWDVASQDELLDKLPIILRCFNDCANDVEDDESNTSSEVRTRDRFMDTFEASIHPDWPIAVIFSNKFRRVERCIILTLLCKAKCMDSSRFGREDLYSGEGLARAAAMSIVDISKIIRQHLMPKSRLIAEKIIRPTLSGTGDQQTGDEDAVRRFEFELTDEFLKELRIKGKKSKERAGRKPLVKMDNLILGDGSASRNWEVRDVNVLLQELEKFKGVCILSTNRKVTLDKALARRISLKLDFKPPTRDQARRIWEKMLPKKLPLADDVDLEELSRVSLTGGEIKNVILNAARRAADRKESLKNRKVTMADFRWALEHETKGKDFSGENREMIGFRLPAAAV